MVQSLPRLHGSPAGDDDIKICSALVQDQSDKADQAAVDADVKRLRTQFEGALANMKKMMAEG